MKIDCYMSESCGSYHELKDAVSRALRELGVKADVRYHTITFEEAVALDVSGSPTVRINGREVGGPSGAPSLT